ncbi:MAG TPA: zf-TFIIB domain-containing protein [Candidatus Udaeobacter sp.]|jgi:Zn-finger nucleic acid-binding protein|nr:zf-TFIIB domain-containing protein [Candidatus Udaeobacter sp.]
MRCPKCSEKLEEQVINGIKVDRCNNCHGAWLDPGELERVTSKESRGWLARFWRSTPQ